MKPSRISISLLLLALLMIVSWGCKNDPVLPDNPYDDVDYGTEDPAPDPPDPNSIVGIHQNILVPKCNNPGCHDGTFEPDFRTVQSAYSTLVYHKIVKNTSDSAFAFRVIPFDTSGSMLIRRLKEDDAQLQRMPATGNYLTDAEMQNVVNWINNGALDMFGNPVTPPNNEPQLLGFIALDGNNQQVDNVRMDSISYNPFYLDQNTAYNLVWLVEDDSTAVPDLTMFTRFSQSMNDYSASTRINSTFLGFGDVWITSINTGNFPVGDTTFFRHYMNDGAHSFDTEFPRDDNLDVYKTFFSFYIRP